MSQTLHIRGYEAAVGHDLADLSRAVTRIETDIEPDQLVPDGDSDGLTGTLNYYAFHGSTWRVPAERIVRALTDLGFKVGPVVENKSRCYGGCPTLRFPILENPTAGLERAPELNLCEANVGSVLSMLHLLETPGPWHVDVILGRLECVGSRLIVEQTRPRTVQTGQSGAVIIECGLSFERVNRYLEQIEAIATWAKAHGYAELYLA